MTAELTGELKLAVLPRPAEEDTVPPTMERALVVSNEPIAPEHRLLTLVAPAIARAARPGQFVMLTVARDDEVHPILPRPMALYSYERVTGRIQVLYRLLGEGTRRLATWRPGERMLVVGPLGRWFVIPPSARGVFVVGRGIGVCSLTALAAEAASRGIRVRALVSARYPAVALGLDWFARHRVPTYVVTDAEGTSAVPFVEEQLQVAVCDEPVDVIYVCGSKRLLLVCARLAERYGFGVQVSLEAHMACGLGYCHGCTTGRPGLREEAPLVCRDGPVFAISGRSFHV